MPRTFAIVLLKSLQLKNKFLNYIIYYYTFLQLKHLRGNKFASQVLCVYLDLVIAIAL